MKKIYSRETANKYLIKAVFILIYFSIASIIIGFLYDLNQIIFFAIGIIYGAGLFYILQNKFLYLTGKYKGNIQGARGEEKVAKELKNNLSKKNIILTDVNFNINNKSNIDHVIIGEHGVFVIETKTHKGVITCYEDSWYQQKEIGRESYSKKISWSPSKQAKNNARILKKFLIDNYSRLSNVFINSIVMLPNKDTELIIKKEPELCKVFSSFTDLINFISSRKLIMKKSDNQYTKLKISDEDIIELKKIFSDYATYKEVGMLKNNQN